MKSYKDAVVKLATDLLPNKQQQFNPKAYGKVPLSVNSDRRLSGSDIRVFVAIASYVFQGNVCRESYAELGRRAGVSRQQVSRGVAHLIKYGHVEPAPLNKQRHTVWLLLPQTVFGQKQRDGEESIIVEGLKSKPRARLATVRTA